VPTTAGTGSECQSFALIADENHASEDGLRRRQGSPRVAILDPALTVSQPRYVTACTGIDAIAHAIETAVSTKANELSLVYSREAFRRLAGGFHKVIAHPDDIEARADVRFSARHLRELPLKTACSAPAHAAANPL